MILKQPYTYQECLLARDSRKVASVIRRGDCCTPNLEIVKVHIANYSSNVHINVWHFECLTWSSFIIDDFRQVFSKSIWTSTKHLKRFKEDCGARYFTFRMIKDDTFTGKDYYNRYHNNLKIVKCACGRNNLEQSFDGYKSMRMLWINYNEDVVWEWRVITVPLIAVNQNDSVF